MSQILECEGIIWVIFFLFRHERVMFACLLHLSCLHKKKQLKSEREKREVKRKMLLQTKSGHTRVMNTEKGV